MGPGHQHGAAVSVAGAQRGRLLAVLAITAVTLVAEVAGGVITGRLALLADAGHMLTDVAGLALAVLAVTFAAKSPTAQRTYGCYRLEILAAVVNGMLLFAIAAWILVKAWQRFTARIRTADPNNLHPNRSGHLVQAQLAAGMLFCRARCRCVIPDPHLRLRDHPPSPAGGRSRWRKLNPGKQALLMLSATGLLAG